LKNKFVGLQRYYPQYQYFNITAAENYTLSNFVLDTSKLLKKIIRKVCMNTAAAGGKGVHFRAAQQIAMI